MKSQHHMKNDTYTIGSRHMGYNVQTEYLDSNHVQFPITPPWTSSTSNNDNEALGGGDILYQKDTNLVKNVYGNIRTNRVGTSTVTNYWLASRNYYYNSQNSIVYAWGARESFFEGVSLMVCNEAICVESLGNQAIRPILTLKSGLISSSGSGTSSSPWILN